MLIQFFCFSSSGLWERFIAFIHINLNAQTPKISENVKITLGETGSSGISMVKLKKISGD